MPLDAKELCIRRFEEESILRCSGRSGGLLCVQGEAMDLFKEQGSECLKRAQPWKVRRLLEGPPFGRTLEELVFLEHPPEIVGNAQVEQRLLELTTKDAWRRVHPVRATILAMYLFNLAENEPPDVVKRRFDELTTEEQCLTKAETTSRAACLAVAKGDGQENPWAVGLPAEACLESLRSGMNHAALFVNGRVEPVRLKVRDRAPREGYQDRCRRESRR